MGYHLIHCDVCGYAEDEGRAHKSCDCGKTFCSSCVRNAETQFDTVFLIHGEKQCKFCSKYTEKEVDDKELMEFALKKLGMTKEELINEIKENHSIKDLRCGGCINNTCTLLKENEWWDEYYEEFSFGYCCKCCNENEKCSTGELCDGCK